MALGKVYELSDRLLDGRLEHKLRAWREDGLSYDRIAKTLEDVTEVEHSRETVRRWCLQLGIDMGDGDGGDVGGVGEGVGAGDAA